MHLAFWYVYVCHCTRFQGPAQCSFPAQSPESSFQHILRQPDCSAHRGQLPFAHPALPLPAGPRRQRHRWGLEDANRTKELNSIVEIGPRRDGHRWQGRKLLSGGGEWRPEAMVHQRDKTLERPRYLTSWNTITPVCALCSNTSTEPACSLVYVSVCVLYEFVCTSSAWIPLKRSPSPQHVPSPSRQHKHTCALWHFPTSHSLSFFTLHPVSFLSCLSLVFFPVCLSPDNSPLSTVFYVTPSPAVCSFLCSPLLRTLLPLFSFFAAFFSLTRSCLSLRDREEDWVDSCSSNFCSLIGQRRSGAAGDWANHGLRPTPGWQRPEGKWSHPCLEIWPAVGYVLTGTHTQSFSDFVNTSQDISSRYLCLVCSAKSFEK